MAKIKAVFYLPLNDNDGRSLAAEIDAVEMELYAQFVGWTFHGFVTGTFRMADGSRSHDESAAYAVVCDDTRIDELVRILVEFKNKTEQEAIYLESSATSMFACCDDAR